MTGTITLEWDDLDRLRSETGPNGTVTSTYDAAGRRLTMTVAGQPPVVYTYDDADRVTQITQGSSITTFGYDAADRRTLMTLPNGVSVEYGYDTAHQLTGLTYKLGTTVLSGLTHTHDAAGRRSTVGGSLARTRLPLTSASSTYNAANQLTHRDGTTFTYDLQGNLTSDGVRTLAWNASNQLAAVGGINAATFLYDPFGRRVRKVVNGSSADVLYDASGAVQELSGGVPSLQLLNGLETDEVLTRTEAGGRRTMLADALGSTVALADDAGTLTTQYTYEPFGAAVGSGEPTSNGVQFTGREADATGLYYYRARYYDPLRQRFVSEDPIEFSAGDVNLYRYVFNDPVNLTGPFGLDTYTCRRPLDGFLGSGGRDGRVGRGNPFFHQFICVPDPENPGEYICSGQAPTSNFVWSAGVPSNDAWPSNPDQVCERRDTRDCVDNCVRERILNPSRPQYSIGALGTDCKEWSEGVLRSCQAYCRGTR